jgi:RNA polymerase sigma-70 factor (ECF subfamily)
VLQTGGQNAADGAASEASDRQVVAALLRGEEATFLALVKRHHRSMIHLACCYVGTDAVAEEVAQDAWMVVLRKLGRWEGRGSLKSWLYGIVANQARSRAWRESRTVPFSSVVNPLDGSEPGLDVDAIVPEECTGWTSGPGSPDAWHQDRLESREMVEMVEAAIETLPPMQRAVITMRDVSGCEGREACAALRISEGNQRVLLHRARLKVRKAVDDHLGSRGGLRPAAKFQELAP